MIARRQVDQIVFAFSTLERKVLERTIAALLQNYKIPPAEIDQKVAAVWYSARGCKSARMSADETADWVKQLYSVRTGRIEVLESSLRQFAVQTEPPWALRIAVSQSEALMTALNDHRLLLSARHDIGEAEMNVRSFASLSKLPPRQQTALCEIEFLAYMVEELIQLLQNPA